MSEPLAPFDDGSFVPTEDDLVTSNPLGFPDYGPEPRAESVHAGTATVHGRPVGAAYFDFSAFGGSMGEVAGERIARALEGAAERATPFVLCTATGGARMQEGMRALAQMPKLVAARARLAEASCPFISVLGNPTTGGVLASIAALADITIAEEDATVGFAGPRLVQRFTGRPVQEGSHTSASALAHGLVDVVAPPSEIAPLVRAALDCLEADDALPVQRPATPNGETLSDGWDAVTKARAEDRPRAPELIPAISDASFELRGDRAGAEDPGIVAAIARIAGRRALVLAFDRDRSPGPAAYRKAQRVIRIAGRLRLPIVTLVDTPGADPSEDSEASGIAWAIAETFDALLSAPVPVLSIVTGEGGSGGALALACGDVLVAYAGSIFSVIAPEAAAEILWREPSRAAEAARLLKLTAHDLKALGIADDVVSEPLDAASLRAVVAYHLDRLEGQGEGTAMRRRERWRDRAADR